jgi:hypothetical protein
MNLELDYKLAGRRIRLIHTNDPYTELRENEGYEFDNLDTMCLAIHWDTGSRLSLVKGIDRYELVE